MKKAIPAGRHIVSRVIGLTLGCVLAFSGIEHLKNPYFFLGSIYGYGILDSNLGLASAIYIPFAQFVLAALVIVRYWESAVGILISTMLGLFVFGQTYVKISGINASCGCFGAAVTLDIGARSLTLATLLFALSLLYTVLSYWTNDRQIKLE